MNTHVHSAYNENNLKEWALSGVTTVRDLGAFRYSPGEAFSLRNRYARDYKNTRLVSAGPIVTTVGGYGNYPVTSPQDAVNKVNGLIDSGADLIKIAIEDNLQGKTWQMLSQEEINTIVQTAHKRGKKVSGHISRSHHLEMAINAGLDDVDHMIVNDLSDSLIHTSLKDKEILELAARVYVEPDPSLRTDFVLGRTIVEIEIEGQEPLKGEIEMPLGSPFRPMTYEACAEKFVKSAAASVNPLEKSKLETLIEQVSHLEDLKDITALILLLAERP